MHSTQKLTLLVRALGLAALVGVGPLACDSAGTSTRSAQLDDNTCAAAEALDDACEAVYGEDVAQCATFDAIDEACEDDE